MTMVDVRRRSAARILVVEDEPGIALGLEDSLRLEGYDVELATNGATACRRAERRMVPVRGFAKGCVEFRGIAA